MVRALSLVVLFAVVSCSAPREPTPVPAPVPPPVPRPVVVPPAPPQPANWEDRSATPGDWAYRRDARGSVALFGPAGGDALFVMRCDKAAAKLFLSRAGSRTVDDPLGAMIIRASSGVKSLPASDTGSTPPYMAVSLAPSDPHLDAMAFSRGKFMVSVKGHADLIIPSWAEVTRVIEDCRG